MKLKSFFYAVIRNYKCKILKLALIFLFLLLFLFGIAFFNDFSMMNFMEILWMPRYGINMAFSGLYTCFITIILLLLFQYVEIIDFTNIKEFLFRINNSKGLRKHLIVSIVFLVLSVVLIAFGISLILGSFLNHQTIDWIRIFKSFCLYALFFFCLTIWYYAFSFYKHDKNIIYIIFLLFHANNIFPVLSWLSIPAISLDCSYYEFAFSVIFYMFISVTGCLALIHSVR